MSSETEWLSRSPLTIAWSTSHELSLSYGDLIFCYGGENSHDTFSTVLLICIDLHSYGALSVIADTGLLSVYDSFSLIMQGFDSRLRSLEDTLSQFPNLAKFEKDAIKVGRDITSARADMKRLEGRVVQTAEDFDMAKTEITKMGNYYPYYST